MFPVQTEICVSLPALPTDCTSSLKAAHLWSQLFCASGLTLNSMFILPLFFPLLTCTDTHTHRYSTLQPPPPSHVMHEQTDFLHVFSHAVKAFLFIFTAFGKIPAWFDHSTTHQRLHFPFSCNTWRSCTTLMHEIGLLLKSFHMGPTSFSSSVFFLLNPLFFGPPRPLPLTLLSHVNVLPFTLSFLATSIFSLPELHQCFVYYQSCSCSGIMQ